MALWGGPYILRGIKAHLLCLSEMVGTEKDFEKMTQWKFYNKGVLGPCEEKVIRDFTERFGKYQSDERGVAHGVFEQMWKEIDRLRERLEIVHVFNSAGEMVPHPTGKIGSFDGISCRDETIRLQDKSIKELRDRITELENKS